MEHSLPTISGIEKWYAHLFETYGWMALIKHKMDTEPDMKNHYNMKLECYKNSCHMLNSKILEKMSVVVEIDRKNDLRIMKNNVDHLCQLAESLIKVQSGGKKISKKSSKSSKKSKN